MSTPPGVLLTLLADEMRETLVLVGVLDAAQPRRSRWKRAFFTFLPSGQDVIGVQAVRYLDDNLERARDHWHEAVALVARIAVEGDDVLATVPAELADAGLGEVEPALRPDVVPRPVKEAAPHLRVVTRRIRDCLQVVTQAQQRVVLRTVRDDRPQ